MKKIFFIGLIAFLMLGCSKSSNYPNIHQDQNQLQNAGTLSARTPTPLNVFDNTSVLQTGLFDKLATENYSYSSFPTYDFSPYFLNGETEYNANNYDLMTHFAYFSSEDLSNAVVEFTFPHILHFVPHVYAGNLHRVFTVNNENNQTVITTVTDLAAGWNPMFCFMVKVDCSKGKSGYATIWSDMKINGESVKGSIKNKVFECK